MLITVYGYYKPTWTQLKKVDLADNFVSTLGTSYKSLLENKYTCHLSPFTRRQNARSFSIFKNRSLLQITGAIKMFINNLHSLTETSFINVNIEFKKIKLS